MKFNTNLLSLLFLISNAIAIHAQPVNNIVKDVVMPPPNAAALGKFGDIPVSYFTGVPNISIPITEVKEGPLSLAVSLSYHASGIKVAEPASWVGASWNLNAGGMISRTIQGLPDNNAGNGYYYIGASLVACTTASCQEEDAARGWLDTEPDIFNYSFGGYQGKFYFDKDQICRFLPQQDLKLILDTGSSPFDGFTIVTPDGTRWVFGKTSLPTTRTAYDYLQSTNEPSGQISTWHLLRVESYDQKFAIDLYYTDAQYSYKTPASCKQVYAPYGCSNGGQQYTQWLQCSTDQSEDLYHRYIRTNVTGKQIQKIVSSTNTVEFVANTNRQDLDVSYVAGDIRKALDEIKVYTLTGGVINNSYCSKYAFSYGYWQDPNKSTSEAKRLKLIQLQRVSCDGLVTESPYLFTYETGDLPYRLSKEVDHWGFYNGQSGNETKLLNIPPTTFNGITFGESNRNSNEDYMKRGVLKEITYPTGGKSIFTYEANRIGYSVPSTVERLNLKSCTLTITQCCGIKENLSSNMSFSTAELADTKFQIQLWSIPQVPGACTPGPVINAEVSAFKADGTSAGNPMSLNLGISQSYAETQYQDISLLITSPVANQLYYFKIKSTDGYGALSIKSTTFTNQNQVVGGLRVQEIRNTDVISPSNDIVRNYEYLFENSTISSARSLEYFANTTRYAYTTTNGVFFTDDQIVPLGTFGHGYHLGYERVKEIYAGNSVETQGSGSAVYKMFWSLTPPPLTCGSQGAYPVVPPQSNPKVGEILEVTRGSSTINTYVAPSYTASTGYIIKVAPVIDCITSNQCGPIPESKEYQIYQYLPNRLQSVSYTLDGVNTTTTYEYDPLNRYFAPQAILLTNSDNKVTKTEYHYPVTLAFQCLRDDLVARNIKNIPTSTRTYIDNVLVDADSTRWSNWASGLPGAACNSTNLPYPWEFYRYEMTYDANGNATAGAWVKKGEINERSTANGLPQKFTQTGWQPETYEWENGLIKKRAFKDFNWEFTYYPGTRLVKSIEGIDSLKVTYTYDALMRLDSVLARGNNVKTKYYYQYKDASNPRNFTRASTAFTPVSGSNLLSQETWQYLDGLGRPTNNLKRQHHPTRGANYDIFGKVDVLTAQEYDNFGRVTNEYVPYQSAYDNGAYWAVVPGTPFALTQYENSPLSRVTSVTPPGGYATTTAYGSNTSVITVPGTSLSYPVGSLYETRTTDPDNRVNITYTDKRGRMILSRQTDTSGTNPADTYYQYDDKDRLTRVIPPGASAANADLIYTYEYDAGDRLTKKKVPGAGHQYMKYNTRDLLVFSRDSNLVAAGQSLGYKYDDYGRVLETGLVTGFPSDPNAAFSFAELQTKNFYDGYDGSTQLNLTSFPQYRGRVRRSENRVLGTNTWLHSTFTYDTYGRITQTQGNSYLNSTTANAETIVNSYDFTDFLILSTRTHLPGSAAATGNQTIKTNYLNDHAGRKTDLLLEVGGINTHLAKYSYDYRERLIERNLHSGLYGSTWAWLQSVDYAYNDQNWLTAINTKNATGTSQALSATCTPALPNPGSTPLVTYPEDNDLFYLELRYDQLFTTSSVTGGTISGLYEFPQKAGNIAQMVWRVRGRERQAYSFNYDHLSRLSFSLNYDVNTSNVASSSYRFNESHSYDNRGNIMSMYRNGYYQDGATCTFGQIDNLTYAYASNTNRLNSITDATSLAAAKSRGFNPGAGGAGYTYDGNGNLKSDSYKSISNISYNHLNLPTLITFSSGNTIEIIYDAAGNKIRKIVKQGATTLYEQDYNGGLEYRKTPASGTFRIEAIYHEEGRYFNLNVDANNTVSWQKEYAIRDHLGSTRITFADKNANSIVEVPGEILQENHYYPFGLSYEGPAWMNDAARDNKYQYNGKEWNDDFGLNWNDYGARWYDAAVGRWNSIDPLAEEFQDWSPYNFVMNNPIRLVDEDGMAPTDIIIKGKNNSSVTLKTDLIDISVNASSLGVDFGGNYSLAGEDVLSAGLDIVGILDPTGIADGLNAGLQAKNGDWLSAGISALGVIPYVGDVAKVGKIGKDVKIIDKAIDAVKAVNGNSKASEKAQHVYEIVNNSTKAVEKVGISGGKVSKAGDSYRATSQVNKLNKAGGNYSSRIAEKIPAGKGARTQALEAEKRVTNANKSTINPRIHQKPKPE